MAGNGIAEEDYIQLSGIQHFAFCCRQWALIHIEQQWSENWRTVEGKLLHERAHDPFFTEKRGDVITTREMPVFSRAMGVSGQCDVVEFRRDEESGVSLSGRDGKWSPCPVEYKRGKPMTSDADRLQLCAQAMCLEEILSCRTIETAYLYYGEIRRRDSVDLADSLRDNVKSMFAEMHQYYRRNYTPRVKKTKFCNACSMKDICLPKLPRAECCVGDYISKRVKSGGVEGGLL
jgi:CRISPR-associated exonuclease Cas4